MFINKANNSHNQNNLSFKAVVISDSVAEYFGKETVSVVKSALKNDKPYNNLEQISNSLGGNFIFVHLRQDNKNYPDTDFYFRSHDGQILLHNNEKQNTLNQKSSAHDILNYMLDVSIKLQSETLSRLKTAAKNVIAALDENKAMLDTNNGNKHLAGFITIR